MGKGNSTEHSLQSTRNMNSRDLGKQTSTSLGSFAGTFFALFISANLGTCWAVGNIESKGQTGVHICCHIFDRNIGKSLYLLLRQS